MGKKTTKAAGTDKKLERLVTEEFETAVKIAKRNSGSPRAAKIYDLAGPILKRRKQAVTGSCDCCLTSLMPCSRRERS